MTSKMLSMFMNRNKISLNNRKRKKRITNNKMNNKSMSLKSKREIKMFHPKIKLMRMSSAWKLTKEIRPWLLNHLKVR